MFNLIRNEFLKIFKKSSTYILFGLILFFAIIFNLTTKLAYDKNGNIVMGDQNKEITTERDYDSEYKALLDKKEKLDPNKIEQREEYINVISDIEGIELEKTYTDLWKRDFIELIINDKIHKINSLKVNKINNNDLKSYEDDYNKYIDILKNNEYIEYSKLMLENKNTQLELLKKSSDNENNIKALEYEISMLNLRIEKNYSYDDTWQNQYLNDVVQLNSSLLNDKDDTKDYAKHINYTNTERLLKLKEKCLQDNINYLQINRADNILVNTFNTNNLFILILVITIVGGIVSTEFSKSTIKLLLIRPFSRTKILLAKLITSILIIIMALLFTFVCQFILGIIFFGTNTMLTNMIEYSFKTHEIIRVNILIMSLINAGIMFFKLSILALFAFFLSTVFKNTSTAVSIPLISFVGAEIINALGINFNLKFLKYFITLNWDFSNYTFGKNIAAFGLNFSTSIVIYIFYVLLIIIPTILIFKKKDIQNQ